MTKFDFKKVYKDLYLPSAETVRIIDVPSMQFLMINGKGDPNSEQLFPDATEVLYTLSYSIKFLLKKEGAEPDYVVPPLEGLWWMDDMTQDFIANKHLWQWTLMIRQPDFVTEKHVAQAVDTVIKKKQSLPVEMVTFEEFYEGLSAQIMHIGPYTAEAPTIEKLHTYLSINGYSLRGKHHEIYLGDPRRTAPEKLKTVIRQPVQKVTGA